jgi:adenylosuccinate synthase
MDNNGIRRLDQLWEGYISSRIEGLALEAWEGQLQSWKTGIKEGLAALFPDWEENTRQSRPSGIYDELPSQINWWIQRVRATVQVAVTPLFSI